MVDSPTAGATSPVPDLLGGSGLANVVAAQLLDLQTQKARLAAARLANGHSPDRMVPGLGQSYAARAREIDEGIERVVVEFNHVMPEVQRLAGNDGQ